MLIQVEQRSIPAGAAEELADLKRLVSLSRVNNLGFKQMTEATAERLWMSFLVKNAESLWRQSYDSIYEALEKKLTTDFPEQAYFAKLSFADLTHSRTHFFIPVILL